MNRNAMERAHERYAGHKDPSVREALANWGPLLLEAADIIESLRPADARANEPTNKEIDHAVRGGAPILSLGLLQIDESAYAAALERLAKAYASTLTHEGRIDEAKKRAIESIDWRPFASKAVILDAARDVPGYLERSEALWATVRGELDESLFDECIAVVLGLAMRAFLDKYARQCARLADMRDSPVVDYERRLTCPVCGSAPILALVAPTARTGNAKRLFCGACGATWKFERIRCAVCGDEAVSDLKYVHDEADPAHRLHVCAGCGAAMPTVFLSGEDEAAAAPDIEYLVAEALADAYLSEAPRSGN